VQHSVAGATLTAQHDGTCTVAQQDSGSVLGAETSGFAQHGAPVPAIAAIWQQHSGIQNASRAAMMVCHGRVTLQEYATRLRAVKGKSRHWVGASRISVLVHLGHRGLQSVSGDAMRAGRPALAARNAQRDATDAAAGRAKGFANASIRSWQVSRIIESVSAPSSSDSV